HADGDRLGRAVLLPVSDRASDLQRDAHLNALAQPPARGRGRGGRLHRQRASPGSHGRYLPLGAPAPPVGLEPASDFDPSVPPPSFFSAEVPPPALASPPDAPAPPAEDSSAPSPFAPSPEPAEEPSLVLEVDLVVVAVVEVVWA